MSERKEREETGARAEKEAGTHFYVCVLRKRDLEEREGRLVSERWRRLRLRLGLFAVACHTTGKAQPGFGQQKVVLITTLDYFLCTHHHIQPYTYPRAHLRETPRRWR